MTSRLQVLLCFAFLAIPARSATIQATVQYDLSSSSGLCCPSAFDQSTVQVTPAQTSAYAAVIRPNYALANAQAQFSPDTGIRLGVFSYARTSSSFDASIGGAATWTGVQALASFLDNLTVLSGPTGSFEWTFALDGTLTSMPTGCSVISGWPHNTCSANMRLNRFTQGGGSEEVVGISVVGGARVIDQLVTITVPFAVGSAQSIGFGIYAATVCDGGVPPYRNCESFADFSSTATLVGFHVRDTQGNVVDNNVLLQSESGFDYFSVNVPEPSSFLFLLSGFAMVLWRHISRALRLRSSNSEAKAFRVPTQRLASSGTRSSALSLWGAVLVVCFGALFPCPAGASIVQHFTLFPEDVSRQVVVTGYYLSLEIRGQFRAPTVDPSLYTLSSVTGTFSGDAGGATWGTGWPGEQLNASIGTAWAVAPRLPYPIHEGAGGTDGWSSLFSTAHVTTLRDFSVPSNSLPTDWLLAPGGPDDAGGYLPLVFYVAAWINSALAEGPTSYPSKLAFVANLSLQLTYVLEPVAGSSALTTRGNASSFSTTQDLVNTPPVYSYVSYNSLDTEIPSDVLGQLPSYLTSSVPEPGSMITAGSALALILAGALRGRRARP